MMNKPKNVFVMAYIVFCRKS